VTSKNLNITVFTAHGTGTEPGKASPEKPARCNICGNPAMLLSRGPGRSVGPVARTVAGTLAPIPDDLEFWVCSIGHRQLTEEIEAAFHAAEERHLNTKPMTISPIKNLSNLGVTITGADDNVDPYDLLHLSRFYPFVEWGVLLSEKRRGLPRYPSLNWIRELEDLALRPDERTGRARFSMHLCGAEMRRAAASEWFQPGLPWRRAQLNGYEVKDQCPFSSGASFHWILQSRSPETIEKVLLRAQDIKAHVLFDPSGGSGTRPDAWPTLPSFDSSRTNVGFAGGITPENIKEAAMSIAEKNPKLQSFWIDMESGVRTDHGGSDDFDLDKVRAVLDAALSVRLASQGAL
jgi:hypothetical protein